MLWLGTQHRSEGGTGSGHIHLMVSDVFNAIGVGVGVALRFFSSVLVFFWFILARRGMGDSCGLFYALVGEMCEDYVAVRRLFV